ncbi:MAG: DUF29 domain-containing protein [Candidatus Magnetoovum sp. WYHC-5]|nr:DUF29 domain-containing protein [Candidatus Magnetoovum sp. WYHC-5]
MNNQITITHNDTNTEKSLHDTDFYKWALHNANLIRQGRFTDIDVVNVVEELESMGNNNKKELASRLLVLIMHLLKWQYQPKRRSRSWISTINTQRAEIEFLLEFSPSLKHDIELIMEKAYKKAKISFENETDFDKKHLPELCPYTFEQLIDYGFRPESFADNKTLHLENK